MSGIDVFAWIALIVPAASTIFVVVFMAMWPGIVAKRRDHPSAEAFTIGGWVTPFLGVVLWPIVLIWASSK